MFTVKATYKDETRRFSFTDSVLFPTFDELHLQLIRVFPIRDNYYLSSLIFSPDASSPGRILVGKEVHSTNDYESHVSRLRRRWPNPLLRFTIRDESPLRQSSTVPGRPSLHSTVTVPPSGLPSPVHRHNDTFVTQPPHFCHPPLPPLRPPVSCFIPPLPLSPAFNLLPAPLPPSPPLCHAASTKSPSPHERGTAKTPPCCSVTQARGDIQVLLTSFKEDLERITRTLGADLASNAKECLDRSSAPTNTCARSSITTSRWCFVCKTNFTGVWYGCVKCPWHAVCPGCFTKSYSAHTSSFGPSHVVQQCSADSIPPASAQPLKEESTGTQHSLAPVSPRPADEPALDVHRGVICDSCNKTIVGVRHKCLDCPDYDLCTSCVQSGATEKHNPFHEFFDIETPGRVYVHTVLDDEERSLANRQWPVPPRATKWRPARIPKDPHARHSASCNLCDSAIVGERYKCVICPDFDTCSSCFRITIEQHPGHGFVRVNRPEDLMIRDSIPLRQTAHLAVCDSCEETIRGPRYKCMHPNCPDFDLCSDCEALPIPVHPLNHPMLKMRTADTMIPTVYRVGQTQMIDEPATQKATVVPNEPRSPAFPCTSLFASTTKSPEPRPVLMSRPATNVAIEIPSVEEFLSPLGSPANEVPGAVTTSIPIVPSHLLVDVSDPPESPRSIRPALDLYHELWPRVNQEMVHLNASMAPKTDAMTPAIDPVKDANILPLGVEPLVADEVLAGGPTDSPAQKLGEHHGTGPVSPVPSIIKSIVDGYCTPSSMPSSHQEPRNTSHGPPAKHQEIASVEAPLQRLDSAFVSDTNVPDGQIFPPGAEFVKGWHLVNNGVLPWPPTTEVQFVAGEMFAPERSAALRAKVDVVRPGQDLDIWTGDLKAPDVPGRYVGYWRLNDGLGNFFGDSMWIDLTVADHHADQASEESLAASSMVMPSGHPTNSVNIEEPQDARQISPLSTKTVTDELENPGSDISSVSLLSVPTSDDEDAEWQDTRTHSEPLEYVVLYGSNPEE